MSTNLTFNQEEMKSLLITILKTRNYLFDCREIKFDPKSLAHPVKFYPSWKGKRGTLPILNDIDRILALIRLHVNSEETIQHYDAMGFFDQPASKKVQTKKENGEI